MKMFYQLLLTTAIAFVLSMNFSHFAFSQANLIKDGPLPKNKLLEDPVPNADGQREDRSAVKTWLSLWYGPDGNYENNGGFGASAPKDLIEEGTNGELTQAELSTAAGLKLTQTLDINWKKANGGPREWTVFELSPADGNHMNRGGPVDNIDTYGIVVIRAPEDMKAVMSPAHDDHAQIWINGEKWYNNSRWTGAPQTILHDVEVQLQKGANVLLYRCGETGGSAYMNLHFDDETHKVCDIYPDKSKDQKSFFNEVAGILSVEPTGKLTTTWADIKQNNE